MRRNILLAVLLQFLLVPAIMFNAGAVESGRAWIGVYTQTIDEDLMEAFELQSDEGVVIKMVVPDSPAEKAGLDEGDIIISVNGKNLDDAEGLVDVVRGHKPGEEITMNVIKDGKDEQISLVLGNREDYEKPHVMFDSPGAVPHKMPKSFSKQYKFFSSEYSNSYMGVRLQSLNVQLGEYFGVSDGKGALIEEVVPDSPAEKAGLKAGDVVVEIEGAKVEGPADVSNVIHEKEKGEKVELTVLREKKEREFSVELDEAPEDYFGQTFRMPDWAPLDEDFQLYIPKMQGMFKGDFDRDLIDMDELRKEMGELQKELMELQEEMQEMKENRE